MLGTATCAKTVSILEALIFGSNGACVDLGLPSILGLIAAFVVAVVVLKVVGRRLISALFRQIAPAAPQPDPKAGPGAAHDPRGRIGAQGYDGGPIRTTGRR